MAKSSISSLVSVTACALLAVGISQCGSTSNDADSPVAATIGAAGGTLLSSDGHLKMVVPPHALTANVDIMVTPTDQAGAIARAYDFEPSGTQFAVPVTMTFAYADIDLGTTAPTAIRMSVFGANGWETLSNQVLDSNAKTVSGTTMHLSGYGGTAQSDAQTCFDVPGAWSCGSNQAGAGSACTPTCATINPCGGYPGAAVTTCTVSSGTGNGTYQARCCFAVGAPICVRATGSQSCSNPMGGVTCGPVPTCAQATCTAGTTLNSCTNNATGYDASCCYPVGALPPTTTTGGGNSNQQ